MAKGEDNVESCMDKRTSSTSSENVPSHVDVNEVITWLRPVREARADAFWKKFSFPPNVQVSFPSSGPHFVDRTNED